MTRTSYGNDVTEDRTLDQLGRTLAVNAWHSLGLVTTLEYGYDALNRLTSITSSNPNQDPKTMQYDTLGNITTSTTEIVVERLSYDAWGKRRNPDGTDDVSQTLKGENTDHGYTGHMHLEEMGLIHMNGRVYDPKLARFMPPARWCSLSATCKAIIATATMCE